MDDMRPPLSLTSIPVDVQETIAFFVATASSSGPPKGLASLLLTSKQLSHSLSRSSLPHLYARVFRATFDYSAIVRRFPPERYTARNLADELVRRWQCLKRIRSGTSGDMLEHDLWLVWLMCMENDGKNLHHLLTYANARSFLKRYSKRYLLPQPSTPTAPAPYPITFTSNTPSVLQSAHPVASAGRILPVDSTRNALALSIFWYLNDSSSTAMSLNKESREEKAENQTMLRLFVFAAQKFDAFLAPWTHLYLPAPPSSSPSPTSSSSSTLLPDPFLADLTLRSHLTTIPHLGSQPVSLSPPISAQAALLSFFARVASSLPSDANSNNGATITPPPGLASTSTSTSVSAAGSSSARREEELRDDEEEEGGWGKVRRRSKDFDLDWERMVGCLDPVRRGGEEGDGLGVWRCRGMFEGVWGGQFAFLDFDSYRDMLSGRTRAIYEGPFGLQPQIWRLTETLVLRPSHLSPFPFPPSSTTHPSSSSSPPQETFHPSALNAGFPPTWTTPTAASLSPSNIDAEVLTGVPGYTLVSPEQEQLLRSDWNEAKERRRKGKGREGSRVGGLREGEDGVGGEEEQWEKKERERRELEERLEIIVTGTGHSAWGRFYVSGRVRCWDGMILLMKEYYPDSRGKWLYRGYVVAGGAMVGRWRDSFSELNYHGYEGSFHMTRRS